ncbi:MAG: kinase [Alkalimonas sp.]|nr:kinase [Alkalimonas sp.]
MTQAELQALALPLLQPLALSEQAEQDYLRLLQQLLSALLNQPQPAVVGISGAQGSGKTTLAAILVQLLHAQDIRAAAVSLDDYYLSQEKRQQLASEVHPLLTQRGVPGTHAIKQAIQNASAVLAGEAVCLPQFDKALDQPGAALRPQQLDMLIVEGWCLGLAPQSNAELVSAVNRMEAELDPDLRWRQFVNQQLAGAYRDYWQLMRPLIWLQAPDWESICHWRLRQEQALWQHRGTGMREAELADFMLSFQRLTQASWQQLPYQADYIVTLNTQQQLTELHHQAKPESAKQ